MKFDLKFVTTRSDAFQGFFHDLMGRAYPGDFIPTRPWGSLGDRKNDGYLKSQRQLFQVYAPSVYKAATLLRKMEEDWEGAVDYWEEYFGRWTFVHNDIEGLGPEVAKHILEFDQRVPEISCSAWGKDKLREIALSLTNQNLTDLFGPALFANARVTIPQVQALLAHLRMATPPSSAEVRPVPPDKVALNKLSPSTEALLGVGMRWSPEVEKFFQGQVLAPGTRDATAAHFRERYEALRREGWDGDLLFAQLFGDLLDGSRDTQLETSALAVLAYFFEGCDIYEDHKGGRD
jgi:hypothetical protein